MNIIILGANQIGCTLAETLTSEANDITVVDPDADKLRELKDRIDIGTIVGHASHPEVLKRAGGEDADMMIELPTMTKSTWSLAESHTQCFKHLKRFAELDHQII